MDAFEVDTVLVPVDASDESWTAAAYAVAIADRYGADLHVLDVLGERVSRAIQTGDVASDEVADDHRTFVEEVIAHAADADVAASASTAYGFSTTRKTQHPGSVILDVAEDLDVDFIVVPREASPDGESPDVLEKAAEYVLLYASQPLLSV
jgi:nucleotide-binding universal stress UspA family protein